MVAVCVDHNHLVERGRHGRVTECAKGIGHSECLAHDKRERGHSNAKHGETPIDNGPVGERKWIIRSCRLVIPRTHARPYVRRRSGGSKKTGGGEDGYLRMGGNKEVGVDRA